MSIKFQTICEGIDWKLVPELLKTVGMGFHSPEVHQKTFSASAFVIFVYDEELLIGFARAISDGVTQAAVYDVAVLPSYQGQGIGKLMMEQMINSLPGCNFILYASPGKEPFYEKLNFRKMKTGMALFVKQEVMKDRGFTE
jgi:ribosomal protein S18 acetylase RimI-like enzyme